MLSRTIVAADPLMPPPCRRAPVPGSHGAHLAAGDPAAGGRARPRRPRPYRPALSGRHGSHAELGRACWRPTRRTAHTRSHWPRPLSRWPGPSQPAAGLAPRSAASWPIRSHSWPGPARLRVRHRPELATVRPPGLVEALAAAPLLVLPPALAPFFEDAAVYLAGGESARGSAGSLLPPAARGLPPCRGGTAPPRGRARGDGQAAAGAAGPARRQAARGWRCAGMSRRRATCCS